MKSCMFYFSCGGTCKNLAEKLASNLGISSIEQLKTDGDFYLTMDKSKMDGMTQVKSAFKQVFGTNIVDVFTDLGDFDVVYVLTPTYIFSMAAPMRKFLHENKDILSQKKVVLVNISMSNKLKKVIKKYKKLVGEEPIKSFGFKTDDFSDNTEEFVSKYQEMLQNVEEDDL